MIYFSVCLSGYHSPQMQDILLFKISNLEPNKQNVGFRYIYLEPKLNQEQQMNINLSSLQIHRYQSAILRLKNKKQTFNHTETREQSPNYYQGLSIAFNPPQIAYPHIIKRPDIFILTLYCKFALFFSFNLQQFVVDFCYEKLNRQKLQQQDSDYLRMNLIRRNFFNLFIQTQKTPNPNFLKFLPITKVVMGDLDTIDIRSLEDASRISPLARKIFRVKGIIQVFYGKNFISVAKEQQYNWTQLKPQLYQLIQQHYESGQALIVDKSGSGDSDINENDSQTVKMIKQILESRVRPFVQDDGGDVKFVQFNQQTGILILKMEGSCSGCPSSSATLRNGILKAMQYYVGQVKNVFSVQQMQQKQRQGKQKQQQQKNKQQIKKQ